MGKTSLVRELLRRLDEEGSFETIFVDLEGAFSPADAIAEIGIQTRSVQKAWCRIKSVFGNVLREIGDRVDTLEVAEVRVKLRAGINAGNWRQKGDEVLTAMAENDRPVCSPSTSCRSLSIGCSRRTITALRRSEGGP